MVVSDDSGTFRNGPFFILFQGEMFVSGRVFHFVQNISAKLPPNSPAGHPAVIQTLLDHRASLVQQAPDGVRSPGDQKSHGWSVGHISPKADGIWYGGRVWENWP